MDKDQAERTAINVLGFLASGEDRLARFLNVTGLRTETIRQSAASPHFLRGVLDYVLGDSELIPQVAAVGIDGASLAEAQHQLLISPTVVRDQPIRRLERPERVTKGKSAADFVSRMPRRSLFGPGEARQAG